MNQVILAAANTGTVKVLIYCTCGTQLAEFDEPMITPQISFFVPVCKVCGSVMVEGVEGQR